MSDKNNKGGRPTEYKPEYCDVVIEKMAKGWSKTACAGFIGISRQTLYDWEKANAEFLDAIQIGESLSRVFWEGLSISHFTGIPSDAELKYWDELCQRYPDPEDRPELRAKEFSAHNWKFNMMNRFPDEWRDRKDVSLTGADGGPVQFNNSTPESIKDLLKDKDALKALETILEKLDKPKK